MKKRFRKKILTGIASFVLAAGIAIPVSLQYYTQDQTEKQKSGKHQTVDVSDANGLLTVHFIDVGQGDSILIQQGEESMLIDAGENNMGETVVEYLSEQGIDNLKYAVGTHPHSDHIGGMDDVLNAVKVEELLLTDMDYDSKTYEEVIDTATNLGVQLDYPTIGEEYELGDATFVIMAPNEDYKDTNNMSLVIKLTYEEVSYLFMGDAEIESEYDMMENGLNPQADVLKVGHHGSDTSSSEMIFKSVQPDYAVISVGEGNSYGHPTQKILNRLQEYQVEYFRTDEEGTIVSVTDGEGISWEMEKP